MSNSKTIKTVIIDDSIANINSLKEHLSIYPEIELQGFATQYTKAINLITKSTPDLVFLDIEMPGKNGFELLTDARRAQKANFKVIFYTAYDKYMVTALRESAFDYILKPLDPKELRTAIERFKEVKRMPVKTTPAPIATIVPGSYGIISLPTNTGLRFMNKNAVVLFQCLKESLTEKPCWKALLNDQSYVRLRTGTTANEILDYMGIHLFVQINQSSIININYLYGIEYKTHDCLLVPPFKNIQLTASRTQLSELKEKFDQL
jgi:two-component system LytT family response regulator